MSRRSKRNLQQKSGAVPPKPAADQYEITEEFSQIRQRDMDKDGKLKIVPKDEVREALGRSPDIGDTFLMRIYFELIKDAGDSGQEVQGDVFVHITAVGNAKLESTKPRRCTRDRRLSLRREPASPARRRDRGGEASAPRI